ncbi:RHS repeat-associated core domain-containing protein, partial [Marinibactrum halimedae]
MKTSGMNVNGKKKTILGAALSCVLGVISIEASASRSVSQTYNDMGLVDTINGPRTDVDDITTYAYDDMGNVSSITNALGHVTQYRDYNGRGQPGTMVDANGITTLMEYHVRSWLLSSTVVHPSGDETRNAITQYEYDGVGQLTKIISPSGTELNYEYDPARRLTAIENNNGERIEFTLDNAGNRTQTVIKNSGGEIASQVAQAFDELSRVMDITGNNGQNDHTDYDVNDNPVGMTNAKGFNTQQEFDALDRLTKTTDADGGEITYSYDAHDRITSVTDQRSLKTEYHYNGFGDLIELISPDTGTTVFEYDNAGNQISEINANGIKTEYTYDALNRLTSIIYPSDDSQNITYRYDNHSERNYGIGQLTRITDASGTTQYTYDHLGGVATKNVVADGNRYGISYRYNDAGQLALMRYHSGRLVYFYYDNQGRVNRIQTRPNGGNIQNLITHIAYQPFGPVNHFEYGNGLTKTLNYDLDYRLENLTIEGDATTLARNYVYDLTNNITGITDADGEHNETFDYDRLDRISTAEGNLYGTQIFDYDGVGNRIELTHTHNDNIRSERYTYADNANQLKTVDIDNNGELATRTFEHDANGNTIEDTQDGTPLTIEYGANNRPTEFSKGNNTQTVTHNAMGQRVKWDTNGEANYHHYDENGQLIAITDATGQTLREYVYFGTELIALATYENNGAENLYYIHTNHLGTPQRITNADQRVVWSAEYEPFGAVVAESDEVEVDFKLRMPGQYEDEITGLNYNWHRDYDPSIGRYVQSDPIGLDDGPNTYTYAHGN